MIIVVVPVPVVMSPHLRVNGQNLTVPLASLQVAIPPRVPEACHVQWCPLSTPRSDHVRVFSIMGAYAGSKACAIYLNWPHDGSGGGSGGSNSKQQQQPLVVMLQATKGWRRYSPWGRTCPWPLVAMNRTLEPFAHNSHPHTLWHFACGLCLLLVPSWCPRLVHQLPCSCHLAHNVTR